MVVFCDRCLPLWLLQVYVARRLICCFKHRIPVERVTSVQVIGEVSMQVANYINVSRSGVRSTLTFQHLLFGVCPIILSCVFMEKIKWFSLILVLKVFFFCLFWLNRKNTLKIR